MILESKNLELAGCYHQEPMSYDALLEWCRVQAGQFLPYICDAGAFLQQAHDSGKHIVLEAQLGAMRDIDYGIFPSLPAPTRWPPMRRWVQASPIASWITW